MSWSRVHMAPTRDEDDLKRGNICQAGADDKMLSLFVKSQRNAACDLIARVPVRLE